MEIVTNRETNAVIAGLQGRMDAVTTADFDRWFAERMANGEQRLVLDMSGLEYISSAGLRSLLAAAKKIKAVCGALALCGLSGTVAEVFKMSGFLSIFTVKESSAEAVLALD